MTPDKDIIETVIVVGCGLMGGSLARAIRPYVSKLIVVDNDETTRKHVLASGIASEAVESLAEISLKPTDLVVLATPVGAILESLEALPRLAPEGCRILDIGSTKQEICAVMDALPPQFEAIGGHPMCGREINGFSASDASLYHRKTFILTLTERTTEPLKRAVWLLLNWMGSLPLILPADAHDEMVAAVSHVPYLVSSTLMRFAANAADADGLLWQVSASGFRDASRISGSDSTVMGDIILTNRKAVIELLEAYRDQLDEIIGVVESESDEALFSWLSAGQEEYFDYRQQKEGA